MKDTSIEIIEGCTNSNANNYNEDANKDDGTCAFDLQGSIRGIPIYRYQLPAGSDDLDHKAYPNRLYTHFAVDTEAPATFKHSDINYNYVGRVGYVVWSNRTPVTVSVDDNYVFSCGSADSICSNTRESYNFYQYSGFDYLHYAAPGFTGPPNRATDDERYWFDPDIVEKDGFGYKLVGDNKFTSGSIMPLYCVYKKPNEGRRHDIIYTTTPNLATEKYGGKPDYWQYAAGTGTDYKPYKYILSGPDAVISNIAVLTNTSGGFTDTRQCIIDYAD